MRKRATATAAILFLAIVAALPYGLGLLAEKRFTRFTERAQAAGGLTVTDSEFHRGWLASTAVMTLTLPGAPLGLRLTHRIAHGPLPVARWLEGEVRWTPVAAQVASTGALVGRGAAKPVIAGGPALLTGETVVALNGEGEMTFVVHDLAAAGHGELRGARGRVTFSPDMSRVRTEMVLDHAAVRDGALAEQGLGALTASKVEIKSDLTANGNVRQDVTEVRLGTLVLEPMLALQDVRLRSTTRLHDAVLDVTGSQEIAEVRFGGESLGSLRAAGGVKRLNAKALSAFEAGVADFARVSGPPEQLAMRVLGQTINLAAALSKTAPEIEVSELVFRSKLGEIRGRARFVLDGSKLDAAQNPMLLLVALKGEAELAIPRQLMRSFFAERIVSEVNGLKSGGKLSKADAVQLDAAAVERVIDEALPMYVAAHDVGRHFRPEGDDYKSRIAIRRGQLFINDQLWQGGGITLQ